MNKKIKRFGIFLLFALPLLYFVFTLLFFSPFEDPFGRIDYIVPRTVDYYVAKTDLADDFSDFPVPGFYQSLEVDPRWRAFARTDLYCELEKELDLAGLVERIRSDLKDLPIDPLKDLVGRELAVAGRFMEQQEPPLSYTVFLKGSWKAKLGYELLSWDWVRGMGNDPMIAESRVLDNPGGYKTLELGQGRTFFLKRKSDLIVFGNDEKLMKEVCDLIGAAQASIDLSLGGSEAYRETVALKERVDPDYLDFHFDLETLFERETFDDEWRANDIDFSVMTAMDIFDPAFFRGATGTLRMGPYMDLNAKIEFNTERVNKAETGFFGLQSISVDDKMGFLASMLPRDVFMAGCFRLDLARVLKIMERNLDSEVRKLITDLIREGRRWNREWDVVETWRLIEKLDATFGDIVYFALRPRDKDKPLVPGVQPIPILAIILPIENMDSLNEIEKTIREMQGNNRQSFEMWKLTQPVEGCTIKGVNTPGAEDIEQISFTVLENRYLILSTSTTFIRDILEARRSPGLALRTSEKFRPTAEFLKGHGNLACYIDAEGLLGALSSYATYWAEVNTFVDFQRERGEARDRIVKREFPQHVGQAELPPDVEEKVEQLVDAAMVEIVRKREEKEMPRLISEFRKNLVWIDLLDSVTLSLNVNVNDVDLAVRVASLFSK